MHAVNARKSILHFSLICEYWTKKIVLLSINHSKSRRFLFKSYLEGAFSIFLSSNIRNNLEIILIKVEVSTTNRFQDVAVNFTLTLPAVLPLQNYLLKDLHYFYKHCDNCGESMIKMGLMLLSI